VSNDPRIGLPRADNAESALLGIFLSFGTLVGSSRLDAADFYSERNRSIFQAMKSISSEGGHVDIVSVEERLRRDRDLGLAGGGIYLMELTQETVSQAGWDAYEKLIKEKATLRRAIHLARSLEKACMEDASPVAQIVGDFAVGAGKLTSDQSSGVVSFQTVLSRILSNPVPVDASRVRTGLVFLDNALKILPGQLGILAGRPGEGKTSLATQIAAHVATDGEVIFNTLEMSEEELAIRITSQCTGIPSANLDDTSRLRQKEIQELAGMGGRHDIPFSQDRTVEDLRATCLARKAHGRLKLVIVDYLQLMHSPAKHGSRAEEVSHISRNLKLLAKELECPIIALSQFSREACKDTPQLHHLRESGSIEQDADWVLFVYTKQDLDDFMADGEQKILRVAKQRRGPISADLVVGWEGRTTRFLNHQ